MTILMRLFNKDELIQRNINNNINHLIEKNNINDNLWTWTTSTTTK